MPCKISLLGFVYMCDGMYVYAFPSYKTISHSLLRDNNNIIIRSIYFILLWYAMNN